jgi:hypothetical protein
MIAQTTPSSRTDWWVDGVQHFPPPSPSGPGSASGGGRLHLGTGLATGRGGGRGGGALGVHGCASGEGGGAVIGDWWHRWLVVVSGGVNRPRLILRGSGPCSDIRELTFSQHSCETRHEWLMRRFASLEALHFVCGTEDSIEICFQAEAIRRVCTHTARTQHTRTHAPAHNRAPMTRQRVWSTHVCTMPRVAMPRIQKAKRRSE